MNQSFYAAAIGAHQQMQHLNVHSNNIANVNTYGFKPQRASFSALMYSMVEGVDNEELPKGGGTRMTSTPTGFDTGFYIATNRTQDYAIEGSGFFALYDPSTQEVSYTRNGAFQLSLYQVPNEKGELDAVYYLSDGDGRQVLDKMGYPIVVDDPLVPQPVGVFEFMYQDGLQHVSNSMFTSVEKNGNVWVSDSKVHSGFLEGSGSDFGTEMSKLIEAQRSYSYALKMVQTSDEIETTIINLKN